MIIEQIIGAGLSVWEEKVVAAACLDRVELKPGMFPAEVLPRLQGALKILRELPGCWAEELSLQVVLNQ